MSDALGASLARISRRGFLEGAGVLLAGGAASMTSASTRQPDISVIRARGDREVKVWRWRPARRRRGTILFSHGAASRPDKYLRIIEPWRAAGYEIFAPLHADSTDHPDHARYGMIDSWRARLEDMRALSDWVGTSRYIAAGHSYGGLVALTLGGAQAEVPPGVEGPLRDLRAIAVLALSPPGISPGLVTQAGYGTLAVPALIQTGDRDVPRLIPGGWQSHLAAYDAAPPGDKYALVLEGVDHYFGGLICESSQPGPPAAKQLDVTIALATEFFAAYCSGDRRAKQRLLDTLSKSGPVRFETK